MCFGKSYEDEVLTSDPENDFIEEEFEKNWSYEGDIGDLENESAQQNTILYQILFVKYSWRERSRELIL